MIETCPQKLVANSSLVDDMNMNLINHINNNANDYVQLNSCGCWI